MAFSTNIRANDKEAITMIATLLCFTVTVNHDIYIDFKYVIIPVYMEIYGIELLLDCTLKFCPLFFKSICLVHT